tara:strand:- start:139 stop:2700 length:2562 start_codon:yes stop_codon:yes gene_type:complete
MLKRIGAEEGGEFKAVASGTLPCGRPVIVNADGTVSSISLTTESENLGSQASVINSASGETAIVYDSNANKFLVAYKASNNYGKCKVGTIDTSDDSVTFGSEVTFNAGNTTNIAAAFDSTNNKVVLSYRDNSNSYYGTAIVGTISGTSISFGTEVVYASVNTSAQQHGIDYDSSNERIVIAYRDNTNSRGSAVVGTVSGTSISFGSAVNFRTSTTNAPAVSFNSAQNKVLICYGDANTSASGRVGTVSGTSISFGTAVTFLSSQSNFIDLTYSSSSDKHILVYKDVNDSNKGKVRTATISGTDVSFGTAVDFETEIVNYNSVTFDETAKKFVIHYTDGSGGVSADKVYYVTGSISGTDVTVDSRVSVDTTASSGYTEVAANGSGQALLFYQDGSGGNLRANALQIGYSNTNLTSENYIGMSRGFTSPAVNGTKTTFDSNAIKSELTGSVYDPDTGKIIICYVRASDSNGLAVVGTVDGATLSFGTPVVFNAAATEHTAITYDTSNDKVVIFYKDAGNSSYGTSIVGTVSGTSISFGSEVVFNSRNTQWTQATFDTNAGKAVVSYQDTGGTSDGKANVGTVSGTSISFGSQATFASTNASYVAATYDANAQKHVMCYRDNSASDHGKAVVGTVSGTDITFGSAATFNSANTSDIHNTFESTNNKVIIAYKDGGDSDKANAVVGTVSGTSISFGSEAVINSASTQQPKPVYNSVQQKLIFEYELSGNGLYYRTATVSGTSIADVSDEVTLASGFNALVTNFVYNPTADSAVVAFLDGGDSNKGNAIAFTLDSRAELANGQAASIDIIGSVSDNQSGLTAGQQYFVQTDGTISTTAGDPSVLAGTAISATELVVKT